jgi:hypothetical protein
MSLTAIEFNDLPPEIRFEIQQYSPPNLEPKVAVRVPFWDRTSREFAQMIFVAWINQPDQLRLTKTFERLMDKFGQSFIQACYFVAKFNPLFKAMILEDYLKTGNTGFGPGLKTKIIVYQRGSVEIMPPTSEYPGLFIVRKEGEDHQKFAGLINHAGRMDHIDHLYLIRSIRDFDKIDVHYPLVIEIRDCHIRFHERRSTDRTNIPAGLVLEALNSWPRTKTPSGYLVVNPY